MTLRDLQDRLSLTEHKARYWTRTLRESEMIDPHWTGTRHLFSEDDVEVILRFKDLLENGAKTASEAIRMMKEDITPAEALEAHKRSQQTIEQLQKKVVALRKPTMWEKISKWFGSIFRKKVSGKEQSL